MKKLILSLITFFMFSAFALAQYQDTTWYDNGNIKEIKSFDENTLELNGLCILYFENGDTSAIAMYKNGLKNGLWRVWHPNGNLAYELHYENGNRIGVWLAYNQEGILVKKEKY